VHKPGLKFTFKFLFNSIDSTRFFALFAPSSPECIKVRAFGRNAEFGRTQQINEFSLDTSDCPMKVGGLILSIKVSID
jgi:hypothetical protein